MKQSLLITTALDEALASPDMTNFSILGEWCLANHNENDLQAMPYHWEDREKYRVDYEYISNLYSRLLPLLADSLNSFYGTKYSLRYWQILIGPWFFFYLQTFLDRWESIRCNVSKGYYYTNVHNDDVLDFISYDTYDFVKQTSTDEWNHIAFREIIKEFPLIETKLVLNSLKQKIT